jgi:hypothetical protein
MAGFQLSINGRFWVSTEELLTESFVVGSSNPQFLNGLRLRRPHWTISATDPLFDAGITPQTESVLLSGLPLTV